MEEEEEEFHQTKEDEEAEFQPDYEGDENEEDDDEVASDKGYYSPVYVCEYQVWPSNFHLWEKNNCLVSQFGKDMSLSLSDSHPP